MPVLNKKKAKYFRRIKHQSGCEFCNSQVIKKQECRSLSGEHWWVLVCLYPYQDGNLMIIPKRHLTRINQISNSEWIELQRVIVNTQKKLTDLFKACDFNIALNIGRRAGNSIGHLHWQIIPRSKAIPNAEKIFADLEIITVDPYDLKKMIDKK